MGHLIPDFKKQPAITTEGGPGVPPTAGAPVNVTGLQPTNLPVDDFRGISGQREPFSLDAFRKNIADPNKRAGGIGGLFPGGIPGGNFTQTQIQQGFSQIGTEQGLSGIGLNNFIQQQIKGLNLRRNDFLRLQQNPLSFIGDPFLRSRLGISNIG